MYFHYGSIRHMSMYIAPYIPHFATRLTRHCHTATDNPDDGMRETGIKIGSLTFSCTYTGSLFQTKVTKGFPHFCEMFQNRKPD